MSISRMFITPSFKKSLIVEQFQGNYLNLFSVFYLEIRAGPPKSVFLMPEFQYKATRPHRAGEQKKHRPFWIWKSFDYRYAIVLEKLRFQYVFRPQENEKPVFSISSSFKSIFQKLRFRDGLVWTIAVTVEIKLRLQISPACGRLLKARYLIGYFRLG